MVNKVKEADPIKSLEDIKSIKKLLRNNPRNFLPWELIMG